MLALSRKKGQAIVIGTDIEVFVAGFEEKDGEMYVKLGVKAPDRVCIDRAETRSKREHRLDTLFDDEKNKED